MILKYILFKYIIVHSFFIFSIKFNFGVENNQHSILGKRQLRSYDDKIVTENNVKSEQIITENKDEVWLFGQKMVEMIMKNTSEELREDLVTKYKGLFRKTFGFFASIDKR